MINFLYKLIFPDCCSLYIGRASNEKRYPGNILGYQFVGPHHNRDVQRLLDAGEICFFIPIKQFATEDELKIAEEKYLKKVWENEEWGSRPKWLLNRSRGSEGGGGFLHLSQEQIQKFQQAGADSKGGRKNKGRKRPDAASYMLGNTLGKATKGKKRPDVAKQMRGNDYGKIHKGRKAPWNLEMNSEKVTCPNCGQVLGNKGALGNHKKKCQRVDH